MRMLAPGNSVGKFFPAETNGGALALRSFAGPLPHIKFCPTRGVSPKNAPDYPALPNVLCLGGSLPVDPALLAAGDGAEVEARARAASQLER
jgi:2-dehydro-3-deoxyphosphogluconate aldolase/(4S)-4-hydroxy-2-oxoglutarate aldolase